MWAVPVGTSAVARWVVSIPSAAASARNCEPNASAPTAPSIRTRAPARAAATAWLSPLPPGTVSKPWPATVSPGRGKRSTPTTRSMLRLPSTVTPPVGKVRT